MTIGDTVFVRWYGKIVEGMIVENNEVTPALASMVVVRIPVQGVRASALFTPQHVYPNAELAGMKEGVKLVSIQTPAIAPVTENIPNDDVSELYRKLQEFKLANWDTERNHIKLSALNDYYDMWRMWVKEKQRPRSINTFINIWRQEKRYGTENKIIEYHPEADAYDGGPKPDAYKQSVSDERWTT